MTEENKSMEKIPFKKRVIMAQNMIKAPKNQYNKFGNFNYRNAEDIMEGAKPICNQLDILPSIDYAIDVRMEAQRIYVKATASLVDVYSDQEITVTGFAREPMQQKGMNESQITGSAMSYAGKYALQGLFLIDDQSNEIDQSMNHPNNPQQRQNQQQNQPPTQDEFTQVANKYFSELKSKLKMDSEQVTQILNRKANVSDWTKLDQGQIIGLLKESLNEVNNFQKEQANQVNYG